MGFYIFEDWLTVAVTCDRCEAIGSEAQTKALAEYAAEAEGWQISDSYHGIPDLCPDCLAEV